LTVFSYLFSVGFLTEKGRLSPRG